RPDDTATTLLRRGDVDVLLCVGDPSVMRGVEFGGVRQIFVGPRASAATPASRAFTPEVWPFAWTTCPSPFARRSAGRWTRQPCWRRWPHWCAHEPAPDLGRRGVRSGEWSRRRRARYLHRRRPHRGIAARWRTAARRARDGRDARRH